MLYPISDVIMHCEPDYLEHFGIKGQRWGIRRFQNEDGSLTPEGQKRYGDSSNVSMRDAKRLANIQRKNDDKMMRLVRKRNRILDEYGTDDDYAEADQLPEKARKKHDSLQRRIDRYDSERKAAGSLEAKSLESLYKNADKMSGDELSELSEQMYKAYYDSMGSDDGRTEKLEKMMRDVDHKAAVKSLDEVSKMKPGKARDKKAEKLMRDTADESSEITGVLYDKIVEKHGKIDRDAAENRLREYCTDLLKEMNLPITDTTLKQMAYVVTAG